MSTEANAALLEVAQLRSGVRTLITMALQKGLPDGAASGIPALAATLEQACLDAAQAAGPDYRTQYAAVYSGLVKGLPIEYGDFLEATLALQILDGRVPPVAATDPSVYEAHTRIEPRQRVRALFYAVLARDDRFDSDADAKRRDYASLIERGCYNATISHCVDSADSYRRQWDSEMFVAVYSARCGLVSANIDPAGTVVLGVEGGSWALDRLAAGEWEPEALGRMTATELCPQAGKAVRDKVNKRINQKIEEKTSALFACPRCHKRNHTYRIVQIGSGDEPSTFMCTCKECGQNYEGYA
jgi:DNA-directed RNA polymerase subunit M/transcription elongation factor TFIIS